MNKVINGKGYNTETAKALARGYNSKVNPGDFGYYSETLYVKKTGEYFLYGDGTAGSKYSVWRGNTCSGCEQIIPISIAEAKEWGEQNLDGDEYEAIFGGIEETDTTSTECQQISVLMPLDILDALKAKKEATGQNVVSLIIKALRDAGYGGE